VKLLFQANFQVRGERYRAIPEESGRLCNGLFPCRQFRLNGEFIYLDNSPVGYSSVPYLVGADGTVFYANAEIRF